MSEVTHIFPAPWGHVEVRPLARDHVGVIVFDHDYGSSEFARGPLWLCLAKASDILRDGTHHPPSHEPGAPLRWHHFPHDGSHRATLPGGELQVVDRGGAWFLVHVRRDSCCVFGSATKLELFEAAEAHFSDFETLHRPLSIAYQGQRYNLKLTAGGEDLAAVTAGDGTRFSIRINADGALHLERLSDGERRCIRTFANAFDGLPEPLWSDDVELKRQSDSTPLLGTIRSSAGSHPAGPLTPEVRAATLAMLDYLAMLRGPGKCVRLWCRPAFEALADRGIRVEGRGEELRKQLRLHSGIDLPGGMRVFRYAMATCRKLGLLVSDGTLDAFPLDDLHDPASDFARAVVAVFGKPAPAPSSNKVPRADAAEARGPPTATQDPPTAPAAAPASTATPSPPTEPEDRPTAPAAAPASTATPSPPTEPESPAELYPPDTWPFQDDTMSAHEVAAGANHTGSQDACDPGGLAGDHVNWFGYKTDAPDGIWFTETTDGLDVIEEPSKPVGEEFYENLAKAFTSGSSRSSGDSS